MQEFPTSGKQRRKQHTPTKLHVIIPQQISIIIVAITLNIYILPVVIQPALHIEKSSSYRIRDNKNCRGYSKISSHEYCHKIFRPSIDVRSESLHLITNMSAR